MNVFLSYVLLFKYALNYSLNWLKSQYYNGIYCVLSVNIAIICHYDIDNMSFTVLY